MPELPEVETSCRGIAPYCLEQRIVSVDVRQPKLRWPVETGLTKKLKGLNVNQVERRGKYILLQTNKGSLMIHLGMSGSLRIVEKNSCPEKHDHVDIVFENKKIIRYNDPRRFGSVIYNQQGLEHPLLVKLGVEPLTNDFNVDYLYAICKQRKVAIKVLIMNSHIVVGVGNIYAQEALFNSGIHPNKASNKIIILKQAIKAGGSSLKDFTSAEGKPGYFQQAHQVYGRAGQSCYSCKATLKQTVIGQRTTVYCGSCQR